MRKTVGDIAIEVLIKHDLDFIAYGDSYILDEIAREYMNQTGRSTLYKKHPLTRHIAILNRLESDKRFKKQLFRGHDGRRERLLRSFGLVNGESGCKTHHTGFDDHNFIDGRI